MLAARPEDIGRLLRRVRLALAVLLTAALSAALSAAAPARAEQPLQDPAWIVRAATAPADQGAAGPTGSAYQVTLPLRWATPAEAPLREGALVGRFVYDGDGQLPWAVLLESASFGGELRVNGHPVAYVPTSDERTDVFWRRPHLIALNPALLQRGNNELVLLTRYRGGVQGIGAVTVGRYDVLVARFDRSWFVGHTAPWIGAALALVTALLTGSLWLRRREPLLALLPVAALLWCLYSLAFLFEALPLALRLPRALLEYSAFGAIVAATTLLVVELAGRMHRRDALLAGGYVAIGPLLLLVMGMDAVPLLDRFWQPGLLAMLVIALIATVALSVARRRLHRPVLIAALALGAVAGAHDQLMRLGLLVEWGVAWLPLAGPLVLLSLSAPLLDRIMTGLDEAEQAKQQLETRVRERELELRRNYDWLRESERAQAQAQERQRIMQDMHDGLGSQLLSSLMLVERGAMSTQQVAQVLRESIDDMRLAIDAMSGDKAGLLAALGNLRFRMEPRMRAAGIELVWDARGLPEEIDIDPEAVLPLLRIVQEALQNAIKHSHARAVGVLMRLHEESGVPVLTVRVTDNGSGIADEAVGGRGLVNIRRRAGRIGAELRLHTVPGSGTMIEVRYTIKPSAPSPAPLSPATQARMAFERTTTLQMPISVSAGPPTRSRI